METVKIVLWQKALRNQFDSLPELSAVYVITAYTQAGTNVVIYTGQTDNIKRRAKEHWSDSESNNMLKNIISKYPNYISLYYALVYGNSLDGHERYLYNSFSPQAQSKAPDVDPKPLTLSTSFVKGTINKNCF